jgi:hypothetical protein
MFAPRKHNKTINRTRTAAECENCDLLAEKIHE